MFGASPLPAKVATAICSLIPAICPALNADIVLTSRGKFLISLAVCGCAAEIAATTSADNPSNEAVASCVNDVVKLSTLDADISGLFVALLITLSADFTTEPPTDDAADDATADKEDELPGMDICPPTADTVRVAVLTRDDAAVANVGLCTLIPFDIFDILLKVA